jgi:hypothetical protein
MTPRFDSLRMTYRALKNEWARAGRKRPGGVAADWFDEMDRQGICLVPAFFTSEQCNRMLAEVDRVGTAYPAAVHNASNGADQRIFGIDAGSSLIADFAADTRLMDVARACLGPATENVFTLGGRIAYSENNLGSGEGWHRDAFFGQFKAMVYLTDVLSENGPFEYIRESHLLTRKFQDRSAHSIPFTSTRVSDQLVDAMIGQEPERHCLAIAERGTLVLFDATGIHRGRPLRAGSRAALTNYYYRSANVDDWLIEHFRPILGRHVPVGR